MSSSEQDRIRELAGRVARKLAASEPPEATGAGELASLRESLTEVQHRLASIESRITDDAGRHETARQSQPSQPSQPSPSSPHTTPVRSNWLSGTYVPATSHPSQEQFTGIGEAVSELVEFFEREKTCTVEPGGKPCDHCGMCSARGF
jgi:hypothetical protein